MFTTRSSFLSLILFFIFLYVYTCVYVFKYSFCCLGHGIYWTWLKSIRVYQRLATWMRNYKRTILRPCEVYKPWNLHMHGEHPGGNSSRGGFYLSLLWVRSFTTGPLWFPLAGSSLCPCSFPLSALSNSSNVHCPAPPGPHELKMPPSPSPHSWPVTSPADLAERSLAHLHTFNKKCDSPSHETIISSTAVRRPK